MPLRLVYIFLLTGLFFLAGAQHRYKSELSIFPEICEKGSAYLSLHGEGQPDSLFIQWSTGEVNVKQLLGLKEGDYSVRVFTEHRDSLKHRNDTTLFFHVDKERCPVSVPKHFSPNSDGYNDRLGISNLSYYPDFELIIYNKMGQRVHHQQREYTEWDGKWLGSDLPDGTYYYILFFDKKNKSEFVKGDITILR